MSQLQFPESFNLVFFGGTGDLVTRKLLPAMYQCHLHGQLVKQGRLICLGRHDYTRDQYLEIAAEKARQFVPKDEWGDQTWREFSERIDYARIDAEKPEDYKALTDSLAETPAEANVFFLSVAPTLFATICTHLAGQGLNTPNCRVVLEKPLGHDLASSNAITEAVGRHYHEQQVYRIDHYLGKESVQNLMALRFGNALFEPLWRRMWISNVQITIAEEVGIGSRGGFYDGTGALRDMVQNHLLQMLCFVAMEPPASLNSSAVRDEKLKVLESLVEFTKEDVLTKTVRGQYRAGASGGQPVVGYLEEEHIPAGSKTETFVAIKAEIANWRWAGVPFYLRTGKRMPERLAEIVVNFREVPHQIFPMTGAAATAAAGKLEIRLQPNEYIRLHLLAKTPGDTMELQPVYLDLDFATNFKARREEAYARLLLDILRGNQALFVRQDELERAWRWVEPIQNGWAADAGSPKPYTAGTWGPSAASALLSRDGFFWHEEG